MSARGKAILDRIAVVTFIGAWIVMIARIGPPIAVANTGFGTLEWAILLFAVIGGYLLADLLAGAVHWIADRFFDPKTPILGPMLIAPFRNHHQDALDITRHDFFEVSGNNALVTLPVVILIAALPAPDHLLTCFVAVLGASTTLALFATNQFHSWAHSPFPPRPIRQLHAWRLILTPSGHARHHRASHDCAYCVTSGWLNPFLDRIRFFERLERLTNAMPSRSRERPHQ